MKSNQGNFSRRKFFKTGGATAVGMGASSAAAAGQSSERQRSVRVFFQHCEARKDLGGPLSLGGHLQRVPDPATSPSLAD